MRGTKIAASFSRAYEKNSLINIQRSNLRPCLAPPLESKKADISCQNAWGLKPVIRTTSVQDPLLVREAHICDFSDVQAHENAKIRHN